MDQSTSPIMFNPFVYILLPSQAGYVGFIIAFPSGQAGFITVSLAAGTQ